jgi:hypothetical protein
MAETTNYLVRFEVDNHMTGEELAEALAKMVHEGDSGALAKLVAFVLDIEMIGIATE